ncbi:MAG: hypothetical protein JSW07_07840 [bacterium]|nr:MAG: hypothetical protein JSW07_07840 [bacterium]
MLPKHIREEVLDSNFSQKSLQRLSDHIGFFLGLLNSLRVKIGIESSENMLSQKSRTENSDHVGLYKVISGSIREIQLTKKFRFELSHILAILAHESIHDYLHHHGIQESCKSDNEIITDLAAAYLGLGGLILKGYEPIHWISDEWQGLISSGYTTHTIQIGYITPENIRYAIFLATKIRGLEELASPLPALDRIRLYLHFRGIKRREVKRKKEIELLIEKLNKAESLYSLTQSKIYKAPKIQTRIAPEDGKKLVEIANDFAIGNIKHEITRLLEDVKNITSLSGTEYSHIPIISSQVNSTLQTVSDWHKLVSKYIS